MPLRRHIARLIAASALLVSLGFLVLPAGASADAYTTVKAYFEKTNTIPNCEFPAATLRAALREEPVLDAEYFADLPDAIQGAIDAQVGGACAKGETHTSVLGGAGQALGGTGGGALPRGVGGSTSSGIPFALALLGILVLLLAIGGGLYAVAWRNGTESQWLTDWRHAWAEANFRLTGRWAEFRDRRLKPR